MSVSRRKKEVYGSYGKKLFTLKGAGLILIWLLNVTHGNYRF